MSWAPGQPVVRREILGNRPWLGWMVNVVEDSPDLLVTYSPPGSAFHFPDGNWPTADGLHPWHKFSGWQGQGTLMMQRPGDSYAVWHFWRGPDREFTGWYVNFEAPFERTTIGFDTKDLELDIVIDPNRVWEFKDVDLLWQRHDEGRFTLLEVRRILELGEAIGAMVDSGRWWWDEAWTQWEPDPTWAVPDLPAGWENVSTAI